MEYPGVKDLACSEHGIFHKHNNSKNTKIDNACPSQDHQHIKNHHSHEHLSITYIMYNGEHVNQDTHLYNV